MSLVVLFAVIDADVSAVVTVGLARVVELSECDPLEEDPVEDELPLVEIPTAVCPRVPVGVAVLTLPVLSTATSVAFPVVPVKVVQISLLLEPSATVEPSEGRGVFDLWEYSE